MKTLLIGWVLSVVNLPVLAQINNPVVPRQPILADSLGHPVTPTVLPMGTGFYHRPGDSPNVVRATLNNMPIHTPSPHQEYTMLNPVLPVPRRNNNFYRFELPVPDSLRLKFRRGR